MYRDVCTCKNGVITNRIRRDMPPTATCTRLLAYVKRHSVTVKNSDMSPNVARHDVCVASYSTSATCATCDIAS